MLHRHCKSITALDRLAYNVNGRRRGFHVPSNNAAAGHARQGRKHHAFWWELADDGALDRSSAGLYIGVGVGVGIGFAIAISIAVNALSSSFLLLMMCSFTASGASIAPAFTMGAETSSSYLASRWEILFPVSPNHSLSCLITGLSRSIVPRIHFLGCRYLDALDRIIPSLFVSPIGSMAERCFMAQSRRSSPLEDLTNDGQKSQHGPLKTLRRSQSSEALYRQLDSSESIPSFHPSIWDADIASSGGYRAENDASLPDLSPTITVHPRAELPPPLSLELLDELSDLPVQARSIGPPKTLSSHLRPNTVFHPTQLEPIVEQRSIASLRSSPSRTRLSGSPPRKRKAVHPQIPEPPRQQTHRQESLWPLKTSLPLPCYRRRALSLDDLECLKLSSLHCSIKHTRSSASLSSDPRPRASGGVEGSPLAEPQPPFHRPPERAPTPPGLPSFGSPEAINYFNRPVTRSASWWRVGRSARPHPPPPNPSAAARALADNLNAPSARPAKPTGITRYFSLFVNGSQRTSSSQPRRASLPAGVLRAEDGTFVRGRFGGRVSGHGIGSRGLAGHPLQRVAAVATEGKEAGIGNSLVVPRRREGAQTRGHEMVTGGALEPGNVVSGSASFSSLLPSRFGGENQPARQGQEAGQQPQQQEPPVVQVAAGADPCLGRNGGTIQPHLQNNTGPEQPSTDTTRPAGTTGSVRIAVPRFWYCWRWFCMCCCDMSEDELDGCGWYGAGRPWLGEDGERVRSRGRGRMDRAGRAVDRDSAGELRQQTGTRFGPDGSRGQMGS